MAEQRNYRVSQIDGKITWQVEELWDGGVVRGPYGTKDAAIHAEEKFATENKFFDSLVLQEAIEHKMVQPFSGLGEFFVRIVAAVTPTFKIFEPKRIPGATEQDP